MSGRNISRMEWRSALWQSTWEKVEATQTTLLSKSLSPDTASQTLAKMLPEKPSDSYARTTAERLLKPPFATFHPATKIPLPGGKDFRLYQEEILLRTTPTIVYMAGYLHTLDNQYDDLSSHCTYLNSRVESLEQQVKGLKREKASLQESLKIAEGEETNTREAYRTLKMDYDKKLKKLAPAKKIRKKTRNQGCQTEQKEEAPPALPPTRIENSFDTEAMSLASLDDLLKEFGDTLEKEFGSTLDSTRV
jgi:outer membrane murein-binding lipoprotein Lpp